MSVYSVSTKSGTRYQLDKKPVATDKVPDAVKLALKDQADGTLVDELGDPFDPETETDESKNEDAPTNEEETDDSTATDEAEDEQVLDQSQGGPVPQSEEGFGHKRAKGKTLSIFSNVPHETVKYINGQMVPMTHQEYKEKTDGEVLARLRELKKRK